MAIKRPDKYHFTLRIIHWLMALIILGLTFSGMYMVDMPKNADKWQLYALHKSFGVVALILITLRILIKLFTVRPSMPSSFAKWERIVAHTSHTILYIGMILIPLSGYLMSDFGDYGVKMFGLQMPDLFPKNEIGGAFHSFHVIAPYIMLGIIGLHIVGTLKHIFIDKHNILRRMT